MIDNLPIYNNDALHLYRNVNTTRTAQNGYCKNIRQTVNICLICYCTDAALPSQQKLCDIYSGSEINAGVFAGIFLFRILTDFQRTADMTFYYSAACSSDCGNRTDNQDRIFFDCADHSSSPLFSLKKADGIVDSQVFAVFDGMGGENHGDAAASTACESFSTIIQNRKKTIDHRFIAETVRIINQNVVQKAREFKTDKMGSTLVSLWFQKNNVYVCNLGDSRAYRLRGSQFQQLSVDHVLASTVPSMYKASKSAVSQYLGIDESEYLIEPYIAKGSIQAGDQYLICSDGLNDMVPNIEITSIMRSAKTVEECAEKLIQAALDHGGKDNVSVIVCRIDKSY